MKLIPAFFLLGFSLIHLIYVIAAPNFSKIGLERIEERKAAAAVSRFNKSKRFVPVRFPPNRRNDLASRLWNYAKYARIMSKRFFASSKARFEIRIVGLHKSIFKKFPSEGVTKTYFHPNISDAGNLTSGELELEKAVKRKAVVTFQHIETTGRGYKILRKWPLFRVTASACEAFKQVTHELVLRVQQMTINVGPETMIKSLKETAFEVETLSRFADQVAMVFPPITPYESLSQSLRKQQVEELESSTYVPVPSSAPIVEPSLGAHPEPSAEQGFKQIPQLHDIKASASLELIFKLDKRERLSE